MFVGQGYPNWVGRCDFVSYNILSSPQLKKTNGIIRKTKIQKKPIFYFFR
jgi:hypothetical protein